MKEIYELVLEEQARFKHKKVRRRDLLVRQAVGAKNSHAGESRALKVHGQPPTVGGDWVPGHYSFGCL